MDAKSARKKTSVHDGHRDRMRQGYEKKGLDALAPHEVLELLLYFAIPRGNTNPTAHELLERFGSLSDVFNAPKEELLKVSGIGEKSADLLKIIPQVCRHYMIESEKDGNRLTDYRQMGQYLQNRFIGRKNEVVYLLLLDSKCRVLFCDIINEGSAVETPIYVKRLVQLCASYEAVYAALAHNHPSGEAMPSSEDMDVTARVFQALKLVEVQLLDHFIIAHGDYISLAHAGYLDDLFDDEKIDNF